MVFLIFKWDYVLVAGHLCTVQIWSKYLNPNSGLFYSYFLYIDILWENNLHFYRQYFWILITATKLCKLCISSGLRVIDLFVLWCRKFLILFIFSILHKNSRYNWLNYRLIISFAYIMVTFFVWVFSTVAYFFSMLQKLPEIF